MTAPDRDEFSAKTKRTIAERACYVCANPEHRFFTLQAHSDPERSLNSGVAAHIRGASPGGPRFDKSQSPTERKNARNGIWLCQSCSVIVDKDTTKFSVAVLEGWRADHEQWVASQGLLAKLPEVSLSTIDGLSTPVQGAKITTEHTARFREHRLIIKNVGTQRIEGLSGRLQIPERAKLVNLAKPAGVVVELLPERMQLVAQVSGGGWVEAPDVRDRPVANFSLGIDQLLPSHEAILTIVSVQSESLEMRSEEEVRQNNDGEVLSYYLQGAFLYERNFAHCRREFIAPIVFDPVSRKLTSLPCEDDDGTRRCAREWSW